MHTHSTNMDFRNVMNTDLQKLLLHGPSVATLSIFVEVAAESKCSSVVSPVCAPSVLGLTSLDLLSVARSLLNSSAGSEPGGSTVRE